MHTGSLTAANFPVCNIPVFKKAYQLNARTGLRLRQAGESPSGSVRYNNQRTIMTAKSILIIEDEGLIALHLVEILTNAGYRVPEPMASGEEALKRLEECPHPDLILMDITLDGYLDGIETAREIRTRYAIPVIFLTAHSNSQIMSRAKEVSPCGYIVKPVMEKDLLEHIERALKV